MSVVDRNVIDFGHEDDDKVTICISDHIPWDAGILRAHLEILQDKVNDYLDYIRCHCPKLFDCRSLKYSCSSDGSINYKDLVKDII